MGELSNQPNIGEIVEQQLNDVGIETLKQLKSVGAKQAWLDIKANDPSACINRLLAIEGAIRGVKKTQLPEETKADLREFYNKFK